MFELHIDGPVARLRLSKPETRNAIPLSGWAKLGDRAEEAGSAGAQVLILSGIPGGAFCSGADISDFDAFADPGARTAFRLAIRSGLDRLRAGIPSIAVVEGACYGAGVAVAMACDIRFAGADAQFAITPAKLGISYPQEDVHRLVSLVGAGQAARLLLGAQSIGGEEAERIGLVERFLPASVDEEVESNARAIAANDPESLRTLKRGLALASSGVPSDAQQDRSFEALLGSDALIQRLAAYRSRPRR
ncbi:MAG: Enoyl-CoA hydratase [uncultured Sphingosinicella sp.]|uniref:Enoyl-CoA hydratase n=1 Tax=uncultured Sphingosinicella sp. TaxID=478748 RepID=A0A6J4TTK8_9SPHN|nr:enoyl-CoA hydratase/isomerase family protein [uncultured Sphingosinicella sp.]CAA9531765.1 MAG: Enoyl-CoA hydratase [uncultured Sphingosinicella sp.]